MTNPPATPTPKDALSHERNVESSFSIVRSRQLSAHWRNGCPVFAYFALLLVVCGLLQPVRAQTLTNGFDLAGSLVLGTTNFYTLAATNGDVLLLRVGAATFRPLISLHAPNGASLGSSAGPGSSALDAAMPIVTASTNGLFTVRVSSYYGNGSGNFNVSLARVPGAYQVAPSDQGGTLTNGAASAGALTLGDLDVWSFSANAGDRFLARMGAEGFRPYLLLYGPNGTQLDTGAGGSNSDTDALVEAQAATTGTYTIVAQSYYANGNGPYTLHLAKLPGDFVVSPGDDGGVLLNGASNSGTITKGDLDLWKFDAATGDNVLLRVGAPNLRPAMRLYGPTGILLREAVGATSSDNDASIAAVATNAGTYTVVLQSYYVNLTSTYSLNLAKIPGPFAFAPGDDGGPLTNGFAHQATNSLGDLDVWTFDATAGDTVALRVGAPDYRPQITLYGPNGAALVTASGGTSSHRDSAIFMVVTNTGVFTLAQWSYYNDGAGPYTLNFSRVPGAYQVAPGDEGGRLTNAISRQGTIALGDLDVWSLAACKGYLFSVVCEKLSGAMTPRLRLFGRNGALLATSQHATTATIVYRGTNSGDYTLMVDGAGVNDGGTYRLTAYGIQEDALRLCPPFVSGGNLELTGYGGEATAGFTLLTSTNAATPIAQWSPVLTNHFDVYGGFTHTNRFDPSEAMRFFRLRTE